MDPVKLQGVALKLSRALPAAPSYTWWSVVAVLLQARDAALKQLQSGTAPVMSADRLIDMALGLIEKKALGPEGAVGLTMEPLLLYVEALRAAGRYAQAAAVVRDATKALPIEADRKRLEAQLLQDTALKSAPGGRCPEAAQLYRAVLEANPDDWEAFVSLVDSLEPASRARSGSSRPDDLERGSLDSLVVAMKRLRGEIPRPVGAAAAEGRGLDAASDAVVSDVLEMLRRKAAAAAAAPVDATSAGSAILRTPGLAAVEVALRRGDAQGTVDAILAHIADKGAMVSCPADLRVMLKAMPEPTAAVLAARLEAMAVAGVTDDRSKTDVKAMRKTITALQLLYELGTLQRSTRPELSPASLLALYAASRSLFDGLDARERGPTDDLAALAAHCVITCAQGAEATSARNDLIFAALALEGARLDRPYSAQLLLPLTAAWALLGSADAAVDAFEPLEVKNIQLDSIAGHLLTPTLLSLGGTGPLDRTLRKTLALHSEHLAEASETMLLTFKQGTYTKSVEFVDFRERIENSHTRAAARAEHALASIRDASASVAKAVPAAAAALTQLEEGVSLALSSPQPTLAALRFNEDLSIRPDWFGPEYIAAAGPRHALRKWWAGPRAAHVPAKLPWRTLGSAEFASMAPWREASKRALVVRWAQAAAISSFLSLSAVPLPATGPSAAALGASFSRALDQLLSGTGVREQVARADAAAEVSTDLQLLSTATLWALEGAASTLTAGRGGAASSDDPSAEEAGVRAGAVAGRIERLTAQACAALEISVAACGSESLALLGPSEVSLACQLALEDLPMIAVCLAAAAKALGSLGKAGVAAGGDSALQTVKLLAKAVNDALCRLQVACTDAGKAVRSSLNKKSHPALDEARIKLLGDAFPTLDVFKALRKVCEGQGALMEQAAKMAKECIAGTVGPLSK